MVRLIIIDDDDGDNDDIISIRLKLHLMPPLDDPTLGQMADDACKIDAAACLEIIVIIMTMEFI